MKKGPGRQEYPIVAPDFAQSPRQREPLEWFFYAAADLYLHHFYSESRSEPLYEATFVGVLWPEVVKREKEQNNVLFFSSSERALEPRVGISDGKEHFKAALKEHLFFLFFCLFNLS